jgi:hypothetical protein
MNIKAFNRRERRERREASPFALFALFAVNYFVWRADLRGRLQIDNRKFSIANLQSRAADLGFFRP